MRCATLNANVHLSTIKDTDEKDATKQKQKLNIVSRDKFSYYINL